MSDMEIKDILAMCDHTLLKQDATWEQIKTICDDGMAYHCASVCIPASYVKQAADYVGNELKICTVIGFPNGYSTTALRPRTPSAAALTRSIWSSTWAG